MSQESNRRILTTMNHLSESAERLSNYDSAARERTAKWCEEFAEHSWWLNDDE